MANPAQYWRDMNLLSATPWRSLVSDMLRIYDQYNTLYTVAFDEGRRIGPEATAKTIMRLACKIPTVEPYRSNAVCQIQGYVSAMQSTDHG